MRLLAIADNTFREGVRQPFYLLVMVLTVALLGVHYYLPFFTLGQDLLMFKDVSLAYILVALLVMALLLASKVVDEEIENRTTLTLMSKPIRRWELIVGKFAGVMAAVTLAWVVFTAALALATWLRVPNDLQISPDTFDEQQAIKLADARTMHVLSLLPAAALIWLQIAVLASIAVAISTRVGMVINMVVGIALFVVAHLTPFITAAVAGRAVWQQKLAAALVVALPYLEHFDLNRKLVYDKLVFGDGPVGAGQFAYSQAWAYVGWTGVYAAGYVLIALLIGMALFRTRELG